MTKLPNYEAMLRACLDRDRSFEGVFVMAVRSTGIFCRPGCPARTPLPENLEFYPGARDALDAGYRPCKRCRPLERAGKRPDWLRGLMEEVEGDATRRWTDAELLERNLDPTRVRRWFKREHGMTFHAYARALRMGLASKSLKKGASPLGAAFEHGFESLSGFNDAFSRLFGTTPGRLRDADTVFVTRILTPLGPMLLGASEKSVYLLEFAEQARAERQLKSLAKNLGAAPALGQNELTSEVEAQLERYFEGDLRDFSLPVAFAGSPFQAEVWEALCSIPYGETRSYAAIAEQLGRPKARRAVGRANGENRLAILIPCHRVVGSDGMLTGYGGGLWRKRFLLELEQGS